MYIIIIIIKDDSVGLSMSITEKRTGRQCWYFSLSVEQHATRQSSPLVVG